MALRGESSIERQLGFFSLAAVVINATIGTGIFRKPSEVARLAGSPTWSLVVWAAGAVVALSGALSIAELAAAMPRTGGLYEFLRRAWGPRIAFLYGWTKITLLLPSAVGSFALLAGQAIRAVLWPSADASLDAVIASLVIAFAAVINLMGVRTSAGSGMVLTAIKYGGVLWVASLGLFALGRNTPDAVPTNVHSAGLSVFSALVSAMWAYDGWADLTSLSGEARDPARTLPRALIVGTSAVAVVYVLANFAYLEILGWDELVAPRDTMVASRAVTRVVGAVGTSILALVVIVSCVGGCVASLMTNSRTFVPMGTDGLFVARLGEVSARGVPAHAIVLGAILGCIYVSSRSFEQLTDAFVVGYFPFYAAAILGAVRIRKREPELNWPFVAPLQPLPKIVFLGGAACVMIGAASGLEGSTWIAAAVVAAGIPASFFFGRGTRSAG